MTVWNFRQLSECENVSGCLKGGTTQAPLKCHPTSDVLVVTLRPPQEPRALCLALCQRGLAPLLGHWRRDTQFFLFSLFSYEHFLGLHHEDHPNFLPPLNWSIFKVAKGNSFKVKKYVLSNSTVSFTVSPPQLPTVHVSF